MERSFVTRRGLLTWMGAIGITAFLPRTGDAMPDSANLKVLFIAGFGPIGRDTGESRKLYRDVLGISLCGKPVDRMDRNSRRYVCEAGEARLVRRLRRLRRLTRSPKACEPVW